LSDQQASLEIRYMLDVTPDELDLMLVRGWRRFGPAYFRPVCSPCEECVSIRIPVARFAPSKSQRRAAQACRSLRREVSRPRVDEARLELYARWHASREATRGWEPSGLNDETYATEFAFPHPCVREVSFYDDSQGGKLVGLGICDQTPHCWSAVYFFYDPDYSDRSIGTANVMFQIEHARSIGIPHVYLGYRVAGCPSLRYKAAYRPHELLSGRPGFRELPTWVEGFPLSPRT
jgi:arginine-tRNA-protein transferase